MADPCAASHVVAVPNRRVTVITLTRRSRGAGYRRNTGASRRRSPHLLASRSYDRTDDAAVTLAIMRQRYGLIAGIHAARFRFSIGLNVEVSNEPLGHGALRCCAPRGVSRVDRLDLGSSIFKFLGELQKRGHRLPIHDRSSESAAALSFFAAVAGHMPHAHSSPPYPRTLMNAVTLRWSPLHPDK